VPDRDAAIVAANDSNYGLGASIWSSNIREAELLARRIKSGMVWINDGLYSHACPDAPWGGINLSGFGRSHGKHGLLDFVNIKHIGVQKQGKRDWNYPYTRLQAGVVDAGLELMHGPGGCQKIQAAGKLVYRWLANCIATSWKAGGKNELRP
jgi:succinate-semialdehyde dehydrogenase/glutarate-semialdehyde dehydrogenase